MFESIGFFACLLTCALCSISARVLFIYSFQVSFILLVDLRAETCTIYSSFLSFRSCFYFDSQYYHNIYISILVSIDLLSSWLECPPPPTGRSTGKGSPKWVSTQKHNFEGLLSKAMFWHQLRMVLWQSVHQYRCFPEWFVRMFSKDQQSTGTSGRSIFLFVIHFSLAKFFIQTICHFGK